MRRRDLLNMPAMEQEKEPKVVCAQIIAMEGARWVWENVPKKHMLTHRKRRVRKKWLRKLAAEYRRLMVHWAISAAIHTAGVEVVEWPRWSNNK